MRWGHRPTRQLERAEAVDPSSQMGGYRTRRCGFILLASAPPIPLPLASSTREPTNNRHFPLSTQFARAQPLLLAGRPGAPGCGRPVAWGTAVPAAFGGRPLPATGVVASGGDAERSWRGAERRAQLVAGAGAARRDVQRVLGAAVPAGAALAERRRAAREALRGARRHRQPARASRLPRADGAPHGGAGQVELGRVGPRIEECVTRERRSPELIEKAACAGVSNEAVKPYMCVECVPPRRSQSPSRGPPQRGDPGTGTADALLGLPLALPNRRASDSL